VETPDVPEILRLAARLGLETRLETTTFYLGRENLLTTGSSSMSRWRKALFAFMSRNAQVITSYFNLPPGRVVELGVQIQL
jgi:KUP system potassium uptake protein